MKNLKHFFNILIILILCITPVYAEDLIVPAMKSASEIKNIQWDSNNNDFSYVVNDTVYVRDSFTLVLKETSEISAEESSIPDKPVLPENISSYASVPDFCITKDGNYIVADSPRTVVCYNEQGIKLKTYTCSNIISNIYLSPDNDTLIISDLKNTLHFYNVKTTSYIGYSPKFGSKKIQNVVVNNDSSKILVATSDNCLYISQIQDILFAPQTIAPKITQFPFVYNSENPNDRSKNDVIEFSVREIKASNGNESTEYITSTKEKVNEKQKFDLDDKNNKSEVVIVNQPEQKYFPPSEIETDKEIIFSDKEPVQESRVTEFTVVPPETPKEPVVVMVKPEKETEKEPEKEEEKIEIPQKIIIIQTTEEIEEEPEEPEEPVIVVEKPEKKKKEKKKKVVQEEPEIIEEEPEPQTTEEEIVEEKIIKKKTVFKEISDEDMKKYFKDGHGIQVDIGFSKLKDPYKSSVSIQTGYRNYNWIRPFYVGAVAEPILGSPASDFPYKYQTSTEVLRNPYLLGIKFYSNIGFAMYPLKNSFEFYVELGPGISFNSLWNGDLPPKCILSKSYAAFCAYATIGAAWDFINGGFTISYDAITGVSYGIYAGVNINFGGSRTIGSTVFK